MNYLLIDTETTYSNKLMTIGGIVFDQDFNIIDDFYEMDYHAYMQGGKFKNVVFAAGKSPKYTKKEELLNDIRTFYDKWQCQGVFAYNAPFDKKLVSNLTKEKWYDIMKIAAYKQTNRFLPADAEYCKTGRLTKNYSAEAMYRLLSGNSNYVELHNAYQDALDELAIMRLLKVKIEDYKEI